MQNNMFGRQKRVDSVTRFADLFDIQSGKDGEKAYIQEVKSTISIYRTQDAFKNPTTELRSIYEIKYQVIGYDEELKKHREMQGLECKRYNVGSIFQAELILKSKLAIENKPNKIVDEHGNILEKISK